MKITELLGALSRDWGHILFMDMIKSSANKCTVTLHWFGLSVVQAVQQDRCLVETVW